MAAATLSATAVSIASRGAFFSQPLPFRPISASRKVTTRAQPAVAMAKAKAMFNGKVVAETDKYETVDGNVYFPPESLKKEYFKDSKLTTVCGWKGTANYYDIEVDGKVAKDEAWVYRTPKDAAKNITNHVAFYRRVTTVEKS